MVVFTRVSLEVVPKLVRHGFQCQAPSTIHETARLKKGSITLILYNSGTLLLQGKKTEINKVAQQLRNLNIGMEVKPLRFERETGWVIGSDEALKGDTFGGLVVAAVKADEASRKHLREMGVADSKTLEDKEIIPLAEKIRRVASCEVKSLLPDDYNRDGSITHLLNTLHAQCAQFLAPGKHIVDKYPGCTVGDLREEKAESKYLEVAAASVLARAAALKQLDYLSAQAGFVLPKGSTHVKHALQELQERSLNFRHFVKLNFSNVQEFLNHD